MMRSLAVLVFAVVFSSIIDASAAEKTKPAAVGRKIENFSLTDFRGQPWSSAEVQAKTLVVVFLGTECPLMQHYGPRLQALQEKLKERDVAFVAVNSNQQDTPTEIGHFARKTGITFPLLKDPANKIADQFQAERTPEVFVLDADRIVRYHGRIDDQHQPGISRPKALREDLAIAIDEIVAGKPVSQAETVATGCLIGRVLRPKAEGAVTYTKHIAPILNAHCVNCHRPGEIGPFSLTNYDEVVGWAEMMAEVVEQQRMPPWHADPQHGKFANDARLSDVEKELLFRWVDNGAPQGDPKDLPPAPQFTAGWQIGTPDQIVYMSDKPTEVPATGEVKYRYFVVDPKFTEDKWIQAAECRPGNRAVVHHIIVAAKDGKSIRPGMDLDSEWLAATAPGAKPLILKEGWAKKIPAGSKLVFQMHYTPNGKAATDLSCIGLKFADPKSVHKQVATEKSATPAFLIPPGADNHKVEAIHHFKQDALILSMFPHMHLRGKAFRYTAVYPDGRREIVLNIPHYDFNWQNGYELVTPLHLPAGSKMYCEAWYDNSESNLANPNPKASVRWGDQTWEEMMIGYFDMALADQDLQKPVVRRSDADRAKRLAESKLSEEVKQLAAKSLESDAALEKLRLELRKSLPQLDRVCWTAINGNRLEVTRCAQEPELAKVVGGTGQGLPVARSKIAKHLASEKPVVYGDLDAESGLDMIHMAKAYRSSVHIPCEIGGKTGTLNFWSDEKDAFPESAVRVLEDAAAAMTP